MQKYVSYEGHLFLKMFKIESKFRKVKKKLEIIFRFWYNSIWKCFNNLRFLRREYLSSAVNGLCPNILRITQTGFLNLYYLQRDQ